MRGHTFLREWRKFKKLSQEEAADRIGTTQGNLSKIERRDLPYNQDFLEKAALAYGCDPEDLISINPIKPDAPRLVYNKLRQASPAMQKRAIDILEALLKAG
jgi:transcriptional regulator with XRE-family HTH domain